MTPVQFDTKINVHFGSENEFNDTVEFKLPYAIEAWSLIIEFLSNSKNHEITLHITLADDDGGILNYPPYKHNPSTIPDMFNTTFEHENFFVSSLSISTNIKKTQPFEIKFRVLNSKSDWYDIRGVSEENKETFLKRNQSNK